MCLICADMPGFQRPACAAGHFYHFISVSYSHNYSTALQESGTHIMLCTPIFVCGQIKSQRSTLNILHGK